MSDQTPPPLVLHQRVRCLECRRAYAKPNGGGTSARNPGCPTCGYVGWIPIQRHDAVDRWQLRRRAL